MLFNLWKEAYVQNITHNGDKNSKQDEKKIGELSQNHLKVGEIKRKKS